MAAPTTKIKATEQVPTPEGQPDVKVPIAADLLMEAISSTSGNAWLAAFTTAIRALPTSIDDAMDRFGLRIYEDMLLDPQTSSVLDLIRMGATRDGITLSVPENLDEADQPTAEQVLAFCQHVLDNLETPPKDILYALTEALAFGHKIAEHVFELELVPSLGREMIVLKDISPKPASAVRIVVNDKNKTLGYLPVQPNSTSYGVQSFLPNEQGVVKIEGLLPPEKCINFINKPKDNDPRGQSMLRAVYTVWWMKQQMLPEYMAFLQTQAVPSYYGILPENAAKWIDSNGVEIDPRDALQTALENIRNGGVAVVPFGGKIEILQVLSKGEVFTNFFEWDDKQVAKGITGQVLATEEASYNTLGGSKTQQDTLSMPVDNVTEALCSAFRKQTLRVLVRLNYGEEAVRLTPHVHAAKVEQQDLGTYADAIAALVNAGVIPEEMFPQIWAELKLDPLPEGEWERRLAEKRAQAATLPQVPPQGQGGDDEEGASVGEGGDEVRRG